MAGQKHKYSISCNWRLKLKNPLKQGNKKRGEARKNVDVHLHDDGWGLTVDYNKDTMPNVETALFWAQSLVDPEYGDKDHLILSLIFRRPFSHFIVEGSDRQKVVLRLNPLFFPKSNWKIVPRSRGTKMLGKNATRQHVDVLIHADGQGLDVKFENKFDTSDEEKARKLALCLVDSEYGMEKSLILSATLRRPADDFDVKQLDDAQTVRLRLKSASP